LRVLRPERARTITARHSTSCRRRCSRSCASGACWSRTRTGSCRGAERRARMESGISDWNHISRRTRSANRPPSPLVAAVRLDGLRVVGKEIPLLHQPLRRISVQVAMKVRGPLRLDACRLVMAGARALTEVALADVDRDPAPLGADLGVDVVAIL